MSTQAPSVSLEPPPPAELSQLVARARMLSWLTVGWMTIEASIAIIAALIAGSVSLIGFGFDSLIELVSASTILWLYTGARSGSPDAERRAQQIIAACFAALGIYLTFDAISTLAGKSHPDAIWAGAAISLAAIVVMPLLARAKKDVAVKLGSSATSSDAAQSWLCAISAAGVLLSILANAALNWWWLDPIVGLGIAGLAVYQAHEAWAGDVCADCTPVGFGLGATSSDCDNNC